MKRQNIIAFFDFDGTITTKDTMFEFVKFYHGKKKLYLGLVYLSPILFAFKLRLISAQLAKEELLTYFFKGTPELTLSNAGEKFCLKHLPKIIRSSALQRLEWHFKNNHKVVIVTASASIWITKWCHNLQIDLLASELEVKRGNITGKLKGINCNAEEKLYRIQAAYNLEEYDTIYAYGDSKYDLHMLSIATHSYFKFFN